MRGGIDAGGVRCTVVLGLLEVYRYVRDHDPEMGPYHPRIRWEIDHEPQPNLKSDSRASVITLCTALFSQGRSVFVLGCRGCRRMKRCMVQICNLIVHGAAKPRRFPEGKLSPSTSSTGPSQ